MEEGAPFMDSEPSTQGNPPLNIMYGAAKMVWGSQTVHCFYTVLIFYYQYMSIQDDRLEFRRRGQ